MPGESCLPNIVCAFNSLLGFYYGKLMLDWTLLTSGLIGSICYSSYIFIFIQYCPRESISTTQAMLLSLWGILISTNYILSFFGDNFHRSTVGLLCALSVLVNTFLLPLIGYIKPSQFLPKKSLFETRVSLLMAFSWSAYGAKISDKNIIIPNILGLFLSLALLFFQFIKKSNKLGPL